MYWSECIIGYSLLVDVDINININMINLSGFYFISIVDIA